MDTYKHIFNMMILFIFLFLMSSFMFMINLFMSKKKMKNREKYSSFECGFDPISNTRMPFSIQFFLISLMFLIFDIEISLLIPLTFSMIYLNFYMISSFLIFLLFLIISIYIEYSENMLEWKFT